MTLEFSEAKTKKMRSEQVRMNDGSEKINSTAKARNEKFANIFCLTSLIILSSHSPHIVLIVQGKYENSIE